MVYSFLPLELEGVDAILGMQWLHLLGVIKMDSCSLKMDRRNMTMMFHIRGHTVILRGDPSLTKARVSLKSMMKSWSSFDLGFLMECRPQREE